VGCLTDIDEVQDQESNIGVYLKNQAETTRSICLVSAKPETEKPVSEADNIKDTDKNETLQFLTVYKIKRYPTLQLVTSGFPSAPTKMDDLVN
jgi:hypothetical protein